MSEYKSPIKVTIEDISNEVIERYDNEIIYKVKKITGIDVDKQRLINALLLDKNLIRCKDCKYWDKQQSGLQYRIGNCERGGWKGMVMTEDDFCSRGEKR